MQKYLIETPMEKVYSKKINNYLFIKKESMQPTGSIYDRVFLYQIEKAIKAKTITTKTTLVECVDEKQAISFVYACTIKKIKSICIVNYDMPKNILDILTDLKAQIIYSTNESKEEVKYNLLETIEDAVCLNILDNVDTPRVYEETLAKEINEQMKGNVDYIFLSSNFLAPAMGLAEYFKYFNEYVKIIVVAPSSNIDKDFVYYSDYNIDDVIVSANFKSHKPTFVSSKGILIDDTIDYLYQGVINYQKKVDLSKKSIILVEPYRF